MATTDDWSLFGSAETEDDVTVEVANKAIMSLLGEKEELLKQQKIRDEQIKELKNELADAKSKLSSKEMDPQLRKAMDTTQTQNLELINLKSEVKHLNSALEMAKDKHKLLEGQVAAAKLEGTGDDGDEDRADLVGLYEKLQEFSTDLQTKYERDKLAWESKNAELEKQKQEFKFKVSEMELMAAANAENSKSQQAELESKMDSEIKSLEERLAMAELRLAESDAEHGKELRAKEEEIAVMQQRKVLEIQKEVQDSEAKVAKVLLEKRQELESETNFKMKEKEEAINEKMKKLMEEHANQIQRIRAETIQAEGEKNVQLKAEYGQLIEEHKQAIVALKNEHEEEVIQLQEAVVQLQMEVEENQASEIRQHTHIINTLKANLDDTIKLHEEERAEMVLLHAEELKALKDEVEAQEAQNTLILSQKETQLAEEFKKKNDELESEHLTRMKVLDNDILKARDMHSEQVVQMQSGFEEHYKMQKWELAELQQKLEDAQKDYDSKMAEMQNAVLAADEEKNKDVKEIEAVYEAQFKEVITKYDDKLKAITEKLAVSEASLQQSEMSLMERTEANVILEQQLTEVKERLEEVGQAGEKELVNTTATYEDTIADMNAQFQQQLLDLADQHKQELAQANQRIEEMVKEQTETIAEADAINQKHMKEVETTHTEQVGLLTKKYEDLLKEHNNHLSVINTVMARAKELEGVDEEFEEMKVKYEELQAKMMTLAQIKAEQDERLEEQEHALQLWYCRRCYLTMETAEEEG